MNSIEFSPGVGSELKGDINKVVYKNNSIVDEDIKLVKLIDPKGNESYPYRKEYSLTITITITDGNSTRVDKIYFGSSVDSQLITAKIPAKEEGSRLKGHFEDVIGSPEYRYWASDDQVYYSEAEAIEYGGGVVRTEWRFYKKSYDLYRDVRTTYYAQYQVTSGDSLIDSDTYQNDSFDEFIYSTYPSLPPHVTGDISIGLGVYSDCYQSDLYEANESYSWTDWGDASY